VLFILAFMTKMYHGGFHKAASLHSNAYISSIFSFISSAFPYLMLNCCLVNYYPSLNCSIPYHADDEESIDPGSYIVTLSLGETRTMFFKPIDPKMHDISANIALKHGDIVLFSRDSQDQYLHDIPPCFDPSNTPAHVYPLLSEKLSNTLLLTIIQLVN
jgi:alkylated DNA repair dioxygenase AlkB